MKNTMQVLLKQFYWFRALFIFIGFFELSFYSILLYRATNSFAVLGIDKAIFAVAIWTGFAFGSYLIHKIGYVASFRVGFALLSITTSALVLLLPQIDLSYPLIAILSGSGRGILWSVIHLYTLKEFSRNQRGKVFSSIVSLELILGIIMPVIIGALITYNGGYTTIYLIGAVLYFITAILPFQYNKIPKSKIRLSEFLFIARQKHFNTFSIYKLIDSGFNSLFGLLFSIIPFLFLHSEFNVGVLSSFIAVIAAVLALVQRNITFKRKITWGYIGTYISSLGTLLLSTIWTFPMLVIERLMDKVGVSLYGPVGSDVDMRTRNRFHKRFVDESAIEMNMTIETIYLLGRVIGTTIFVIIVQMTSHNALSIVKIIVGVIALWKLTSYVWMVSLYKKLQPSK